VTAAAPSRRARWAVWLPTAAGAAIFFGLAGFGAATSPSSTVPIDDWRVVLALAVGCPAALAGLFVSAWLVRRDMQRRLDERYSVPPAEEALVFATHTVHRPGAGRGRFPWTVGGLLTLTDVALRFRPHAGEFRDYEVVIPLQEVEAVRPCRAGWLARGLRVVRTDGSAEEFVFAGFPARRAERFVEQIRDLIEQTRGAI
jgi:hypothetical protein